MTTTNIRAEITFAQVIEILTDQRDQLEKCVEKAHEKFASGEWTAQQRQLEILRVVNVQRGLSRALVTLKDAVSYNETITQETEAV